MMWILYNYWQNMFPIWETRDGSSFIIIITIIIILFFQR